MEPSMLVTIIILFLLSLSSAEFIIRGDANVQDVSLSTNANNFTNYLNTEADVPDNFETRFTWKPNAARIGKLSYFVDAVLVMGPLGLGQGWNDRITFKELGGLATKFKLVSSRLPGSPGLQTKTAMWSLRHLMTFLYEGDRFGEISFLSQFGQGPALGFGQLLAGPLQSSQSENFTLSQDNLQAQSGVYASNFRRRSNVLLNDYGIYITLMSIIIQVTAKAVDSPDGLETVVHGMVATRNADYDISVAIGSSSPKSENMTLRKVILTVAKLGSQISKFKAADRFRSFDFLVREGEGAIVGRGVVVKGLPPVSVGNVLDVPDISGEGELTPS